MSAEWAQVGVNVLVFLVLLLTLFRVAEQAEASQKPCVVIKRKPAAKPLDAAAQAASRGEMKENPNGSLIITKTGSYGLRLADGPPTFENIGAGPAVRVRIIIEKMVNGAWEEKGAPADVGYAARGEPFNVALVGLSTFPDGDDKEYRVTASYQSLSGRRYLTETVIKNRWFQQFEFRRVGLIASLLTRKAR